MSKFTLEYIQENPFLMQIISTDSEQAGIRTLVDQLLSAAIIRNIFMAYPDTMNTSTLSPKDASVAIAFHPDTLNFIQPGIKNIERYEVTCKEYLQFSEFTEAITKDNIPPEKQAISIQLDNINETGLCVFILSINLQSRLIAMDYATILKERLGLDHLPIYYYTPFETQHLSEYNIHQQQLDIAFCNKPMVVKGVLQDNANHHTLLGMRFENMNLSMKCWNERTLMENLFRLRKIELLESIISQSEVDLSAVKDFATQLPIHKLMEMAIIKNCRNVFLC